MVQKAERPTGVPQHAPPPPRCPCGKCTNLVPAVYHPPTNNWVCLCTDPRCPGFGYFHNHSPDTPLLSVLEIKRLPRSGGKDPDENRLYAILPKKPATQAQVVLMREALATGKPFEDRKTVW